MSPTNYLASLAILLMAGSATAQAQQDIEVRQLGAWWGGVQSRGTDASDDDEHGRACVHATFLRRQLDAAAGGQ